MKNIKCHTDYIKLMIGRTSMAVQKFDPVLKEASKKIKAILNEANICGFVQLVSSTNAEYINHLQDWSGIKYDYIEHAYRILIKQKKIGKKRAKELTENAAHVMHMLSSISSINFQFSEEMISMMEEAGIEIERSFSRPDYTPDN